MQKRLIIYSIRFFICIIISYSELYAQKPLLKILDEHNNPLEGAMVSYQDSIYIGSADQFGLIPCNLKNIDTLCVRFLGYKTKKQPITVDFIKNPTIQLELEPFGIEQINISHSIKALDILATIDLKVKPVSSSQEILRTVPGLFIGQHAGGGKAEQLFLRGFDVDHGTDVAVSVEGMPVNMVSHAHGQGYADLHFILPEAVESIDFGKGPYYADKGNFATAAFVDFKLKEKLDESFLKLEAGQYNSFRLATLYKLLNTTKSSAYVGGEYNTSDGWFESPQNFFRTNLLAKWKYQFNARNSFSFTSTYFKSKWDASGQIPERAVHAGTISRFGAIDNTEGGETERQNLMLNFSTKWDHWTLQQHAYLSRYAFELYSNFTFFLNDPIQGDQIMQKENRWLSGYHATLTHKNYKDYASFIFNIGAGLRNDNSKDNHLSHTINRTKENKLIRKGNIQETNTFVFADYQMDFGKLLISPALRLDRLYFNYQDAISGSEMQNHKPVFSPKISFVFQKNNKLQYYLKTGVGFHSNDTRVVLENSVQSFIPKATGADLGLIWKPQANFVWNAAVWALDLQQEFVYVGDEGIIEPSGKTRRVGIDIGCRYQPKEWLFLNLDANYSKGRNRDYEGSNKYIPLAPVLSSVGTLTTLGKNFSGSISFRYLSDRPATEDYTLTANGYLVHDLAINYKIKNVHLLVRAENIFNVDWNETQFATTSRLKDEINPVEEIHFTPGTPFFIKAGFSINF